MLGLSVLPALLQFMGFLFLPESPRWLIQRGLTQKARRVLSQIRGNQNIDEEYDSIKNSIEEEEKDSGGGEWTETEGVAERGMCRSVSASAQLSAAVVFFSVGYLFNQCLYHAQYMNSANSP